MQFESVHGVLYASTIIALVIVGAELCVMVIPRWQTIDIEHSGAYLQVGLWSVCMVKPNESDCCALGDFNKKYISMTKIKTPPQPQGSKVKQNPAFDLRDSNSPAIRSKRAVPQGCNRTEAFSRLLNVTKVIELCDSPFNDSVKTDQLETTAATSMAGDQAVNNEISWGQPWDNPEHPCNAVKAPLVTGATYSNDTSYGHSHVHYTCIDGYVPTARYGNDVFCTCSYNNPLNCTWTTPPVCLPDDTLCLFNGLDSDVCTVGDRTFLLQQATSVVNANLDIPVPEANFTTAVYIFPQLRFPCGGDLRQWDIVTKTPGSVYLDVWREEENGTFTLIYSELTALGAGTTGYVLKIENRVDLDKGDYVGIHYDDFAASNESVIFARIQDPEEGYVLAANMSNSDLIKAGSKLDRSQLFKIENGSGNFYPAIVAYVTLGESVPVKVSVVQALPVLSLLSSILASVFLIVAIVYLFKYESKLRLIEPGNNEARNDVGDWLFQKASRYYQAAIMCALFAGLAQVDGFALFFQLYNCNQARQWHFGPMGILLIVTGCVSTVLVIPICIAERKMITYISSPVMFSEMLPDILYMDSKTCPINIQKLSRASTPSTVSHLSLKNDAAPTAAVNSESSASIDNSMTKLLKKTKEG